MTRSFSVFAGFLLVVLVAGFVSATGTQEVGSDGSSSVLVNGRYEPPITLTTPMPVHNPDDWAGGDSYENNAFTRWVAEELGVQFEAKWYFPDHAANATRLSLAMASSDMPDVVYAPDQEIAKLAQGGALAPLGDAFDEYASPLTMHIIGLNQDYTGGRMFWPYTLDGEYYAVPHSAEIVWNVNWIRSDTLESLGFDTPDTLDDMEEILAAYMERYPDGTGFVLHQDLSGMETVMQAYGAFPKAWIEGPDGSLVYGSVQPQVRQGLETLAQWYRLGYIDREFVVKDFSKALVEPVAAGQTLAHFGPWWNVWWPFPDMWANDPEAEMASFAPLEQDNGRRELLIQSPFYGWGTAVRAGHPQPEALVLVLNEVVDSFNRNDLEMRELVADRYGYEFKYPVTPVQTPENPDAPDYAQRFAYEQPGYGFFNDGASHHNRSIGFFLRNVPDILFREGGMFDRLVAAVKEGTEEELGSADALELENLSQIPNRVRSQITTTELVQSIRGTDTVRFNLFQGAPTPAMTESKAYLDKLELETFVKVIMGEEPITAFDRFVEEWTAAGGDTITDEVNAWYAGVLQ